MIVDLYVKERAAHAQPTSLAQVVLLPVRRPADAVHRWSRRRQPATTSSTACSSPTSCRTCSSSPAYLAVSAALVYSRQYLLDRGLLRGEFFTLLLFALLGMMVMISANSFLTVYLGLELLSLCLYAMVALNRDSARLDRGGDEVLRARRAASGLLLYGMSMIYGATGTLDITEVASRCEHCSCTASQNTRSSCSAWCSSSPGSPSSSAWCRSTCGSRTSTTARPPR